MTAQHTKSTEGDQDFATAPDLEAGVARFVESIARESARRGDPASRPYPEGRKLLETIRAPWAEGGPEMASTEDLEAPGRDGGIRVRLHRPEPGGSRPALVYLHGGGWTYFSLDTHDRLMREYAARAGINVVGVDYALSPESKYPVALYQVVDVLNWLVESGESLGIDPSRLAVGGDSAGANLAVAACLQLRDAGPGVPVRAMLLNYGAFEAILSSDAQSRYGGDGYMLGADEMHGYWNNYIRNVRDLQDPLVCPMLADPAGLPPAFFCIAACDVLAEQNRVMADRMEGAGVDVEARAYEGASHSFLEAVSVSALAGRALDDASGWLRDRLA